MTPHIESKKEDVANIVLMPGDPLRAKYIAEKFLDDYKLINEVRNMFGYTGFYKGKRITIFGSGMGIPSMSIYAYELYHYYEVDTIIRIGSSGSLSENIKINDVVLSESSYTESNFAYSYSNIKKDVEYSTKILNEIIIKTALDRNIKIHLGQTVCTEVFDPYTITDDFSNRMKGKGIAAEMEAFALFHIANQLKKNAACLMTISDSGFETKELTSEERETNLNEMILLALESSLKL